MAPTCNTSALSHLHREVTLLPRYFSPFQRHHYRSLNDISCTSPCNIHALLLFSSFCHTFTLRNDRSRAQRISAAWHFSSLTQVHTETALHLAPPLFFYCGRSPLVVFAPSTAAYTFRFAYRTAFAVFCVCCFVLAVVPCFFACQFSRNYPRQFFRGGHSYIVDLTFRITNWSFLLATVSRTWDLVCINLSFASRDFVCARSTPSAFHCVRANDLDFAFCIGTYRRGHHALRESSFVSPAHGPRWLFLLSRHRKAISAAANQKPFVNKDLCTRKSVKRTIKWWKPNALLRLGNLKCQAVLVGS